MSNHDHEHGKTYPRDRRRYGTVVIVLGVLVVLGLAFMFFSGDDESSNLSTTFAAVRGDLKISVLEGGTLRALESQRVRSEVKGWPKILSIVEEGYRVTAQDVADGLILVELDKDELEERRVNDELSYQADSSNLMRVEQELEIQILDNDSTIKAAELQKKFAFMEFEKYMGVEAAREILEELDLENIILSGLAAGSYSAAEEEIDEEPTELEEVPAGWSGPGLLRSVIEDRIDIEPSPEETLAEDEEEAADFEMEFLMTRIPEVDFQSYAKPEKLGDGAARQKLREFDDGLAVAERRYKLDKTKLEGTRRLFDGEFITPNELETEEMKVANSLLSTKSAETARSLFIRYEFPKEAEQRLSDYENSLRNLVRKRKQTASWLSGKRVELSWAKKQAKVRLKKLNEDIWQLERTVLRAEREGLVVYGGDDKEQWGSDQVKEGAAVRQWQTILTIPDMNTMTVLVKIHESDIKSIQIGQKADIVVDAFIDQPLTGVVDKVAVLANSQDRFMNPDLKLYDVLVRIDETYEWVKPGMSAEAEIQVDELLDILYIPILAVQSIGTERFCYVATGGRTPERRIVETGQFNDQFIVITSGLEEGERVHLRVPTGSEETHSDESDAEEREAKSHRIAAAVSSS